MTDIATITEASKALRQERAAWRRALRRDPEGIQRALMERPEPLLDITVAELLAWARYKGLRAMTMEKVGRRAISDGVNLFVPLGRASERTRTWAVENGMVGVIHARADIAERPEAPWEVAA